MLCCVSFVYVAGDGFGIELRFADETHTREIGRNVERIGLCALFLTQTKTK